MAMIVVSSKIGEDSAKLLAKSLGCMYEDPFKTDHRNFGEFDLVFKYGFSPKIKAKNVINTEKATNRALNKYRTLELLAKEPFCIKFTPDFAKAAEWVKTDTVVARNILDGHNGIGLTYCNTLEELKEAPALFYTKYIEHTHEFRVNCWKNKVVSVYDKINKGTGEFKFDLFQGVEEHPQLKTIVEKVYSIIKLDWYGMDIIRNEAGDLFFLEINSAPILFPYTLKKLTAIIKEVHKEIVNG